MKRKSIKKLTVVFISLFIVCVCLATVLTFPVSAAFASNNGYVYRDDYTTKDKKPTYTATLNENNRLLKELNKKENKLLKTVKSDGKDWVNDGIAVIKAINSSDEVDAIKIGVKYAKKILNSLPGAWSLLGTAADIIESLSTSGQAPLSEVQVLADDIDQRFNAMSDQLYDIEEQLSSLSNQVTSSVNDVLSGTQTQINNLEAKQILRSFMSSGEGNFSYLEYSNYLYGSKSNQVNASEAYYILLLEAIQSGASDELIEYYYNKLFESIYSNIHIYNQYYYGGVAGLDKSIAEYYYDYLSYNPNLVDDGTSAEYQALLFALDLYTTYVYSYEMLEMCFAYQTTDMYLEALLENRDISDIDTYEYADGKLITYSEIKRQLVEMQTNLVLAEEQIAEDIAYIFGMKDSYIVVDDNGDVHGIGNYGEEFGNVADNQTIYLNVLPDEICELFALNVNNFRCYVDGTEQIGTDKAIIDVSAMYSDTFTASVTYGNAEIYNIEFTNIDSVNKNSQKTPVYEFSGGSGTANDPYLISNALQFDLVANDLHACYQLISDLVVPGTHSPIGTEKKPFNGTFDGNGYTISNLTVQSLAYDSTNITMNPTTGMFGTIGKNGVVKNLTLETLQVDSDYEKDSVKPENDNSYYYIGGIAGVNKGKISNCTITENSKITVNRKKEMKDSRIVNIYVGGIAGDNSGTVEYCSVDSLSVDATSYHYYYNEGINENKHTLCVGGIAAVTNNIIQSCRVSENTSLSAYAKSIANSSDNEKPILKVFVGGIVADDSAMQYISNVYSACNIAKCKGDIYNEGTYFWVHRYSWDNVNVKKWLYYPSSSSDAELNGKIVSSYSDPVFVPAKDTMDVNIELTENISDINAKYLTEYFNKLIDEENNEKNVKFVDASGKTVDATVVGYYGFNTYHESENAQTITVRVFFYVNDTLMSDDVTIVVKAKELIDWQIEGFVDASFDKGADASVCLDKIFEHGFKIVYIYSNGQKEEFTINADNRDVVDIYNLDTSEYGIKNITIYHNEQPNVGKLLKFEQAIEFACHHTNNDFDKTGTVDADCKFMGYEIWKCSKCGEEIRKNYVKGDHTYVVTSGKAATCHEAGYTQKVSCSVCGEIFEESEWIQALPHNYVSSSESGYIENALYPASEYHYCSNGNHYESHQYTVEEYVDENGTLVYRYSCFCGYENPVPDYNIKTKENGERPTVVVTNGYVLKVGDEVVVYVQIINNPGFLGATFGIRYDNGLELVSADESMIVPQQLKVRNEVYNGYNFLWAMGDSNKTVEDGYLLKLKFRYVDETKRDQHISVVYGMSNGADGGFCTLDGEYHLFMTQSGTISVVDHLPGDVNKKDGKEGDGVVDIMDATYIAWSIVGKVDEKGNKIQVNTKYADVNLDGKVDLLDVIAILQSISGRYGTSLLSSDYKLFFNLNGFICDDADDSVMVKFYDENGNRTQWSENVDFAKYEALMKRLGYSFAGWYTRMACTCTDDCKHIVKASDFISYDKYQSNQMLYARWERNRIVFDMNGADLEPFADIPYSKPDYEKIDLTEDKYIPTWTYDINCDVDGVYYDKGKIYKDFLGWQKENGDFVTAIDLFKENLGTTKLTAVWSEYKWETPDKIERGYEPITEWFFDSYCGTNKITNLDENAVETIVKNGCKIYSKRIAIKYTITYNNTRDVVNSNSTEYCITDIVSLSDLSDYIGYEFDCWLDENGNKITSIAKGTIGDISLTAKWNAKVYTITVEVIDVNPSNMIDSNGNPKYSSKSLKTLYYTYGDDAHEQGFYLDQAFVTKLSTNYFDEYCVNKEGETNFIFGGLYTSQITDNGHTYATYASNSCVLSSEFELVGTPRLGEVSKAGTLYALLTPKQYTITLDHNISSKPVLSVTNTDSTQSVKSYYNEVPEKIAIMPQSAYYVPAACSTKEGTKYFDADGEATNAYNISGNTTMYCQWKQKYEDYTYIYDKSTLKGIRASGKYLVICDIDMGGASWTPKDSFSGELDGDGHCVYNFSINDEGSGTATIAFIKVNTGIIKDLIIGKTGIKTYDSQYSVKYNVSYTESDSESYLTVGGFVGENKGTISGCKLVNAYISATFADNDNNKNLFLYVGGIATTNFGTISNCHVLNCNIDANATCPKESGDNNYAWLGGICGKNGGELSQCSVQATILDLDVRGDGYWQMFGNNYAYPWGALGGIVGEQLRGTTTSCSVNGNTLKKYGSEGKYTKPTLYQNEVCGLMTGGTIA